MKRSAFVIVVCLVATVLASCSSDSSTSSASSTTEAAQTTTGTADPGDNSSGAPSIPDSKAIDELTNDLTNMKAADLVAKCNVLATVVLGKDVGMDNDPDVKDALDALTNVVLPLDRAVADALAGDAKAAADWCKAKGMTN